MKTAKIRIITFSLLFFVLLPANKCKTYLYSAKLVSYYCRVQFSNSRTSANIRSYITQYYLLPHQNNDSYELRSILNQMSCLKLRSQGKGEKTVNLRFSVQYLFLIEARIFDSNMHAAIPYLVISLFLTVRIFQISCYTILLHVMISVPTLHTG